MGSFMPLSCYATKGTVKVSWELAYIYYLLQTLCSTHEGWTCWQKIGGHFQSQIPIAEGMSSAVGYRLSFAVNFLDYTWSFQWFSSFMEILLKQPTFLKFTLSVQLLVVWWSEVFLRAIVSTLKSHGNTKGGEKKKNHLWAWHSTKVSGWY